jgi:RNA polymerase sigma-54 factor
LRGRRGAIGNDDRRGRKYRIGGDDVLATITALQGVWRMASHLPLVRRLLPCRPILPMNQASYSLNARQQLALSPRLQQAVRLLQMSALEFHQELAQRLADNPFLEEQVDDGSEPPDDQADVGIWSGDAGDPASLDPDQRVALSMVDVDTDTDETRSRVDDLRLADDDRRVSGELSEAEGHRSARDPWEWLPTQTTLRGHLREQILGSGLGERASLAAALIVESLDDDGYLRDLPRDAAHLLPVQPPFDDDELAAAVADVQQFDPPGIAARTLSECLTLQLAQLAPATPGRRLAVQLASRHLDALARHDYTSLRRLLDCSGADLAVAHGLIRRLDPKPGQRLGAARTEYIEPDVLVIERHGRLVAIVNPEVLPRARLNRSCVDLMRSVNGSRHPAMQAQLQEARWLLRNAGQRQLTIQRVAAAIIKRQRAFFQYGEVAIRPLLLRELAEELKLHESTLSRATINKYMATPRGTFSFRHFFSRELGTDTGGTCSAAAVKALIGEMIEAESRSEPLSDVQLARRLGDSGIRVARRTVAKYRNQLKLPPWELRHLP